MSGWILDVLRELVFSKSKRLCKHLRFQYSVREMYWNYGTRGLLGDRCGQGRPEVLRQLCLDEPIDTKLFRLVEKARRCSYLLVDVYDHIVASIRHVYRGSG